MSAQRPVASGDGGGSVRCERHASDALVAVQHDGAVHRRVQPAGGGAVGVRLHGRGHADAGVDQQHHARAVRIVLRAPSPRGAVQRLSVRETSAARLRSEVVSGWVGGWVGGWWHLGVTLVLLLLLHIVVHALPPLAFRHEKVEDGRASSVRLRVVLAMMARMAALTSSSLAVNAPHTCRIRRIAWSPDQDGLLRNLFGASPPRIHQRTLSTINRERKPDISPQEGVSTSMSTHMPTRVVRWCSCQRW